MDAFNDTDKEDVKKAIDKSKKDEKDLSHIDWYLENKKRMGFSNPKDMLHWYFNLK